MHSEGMKTGVSDLATVIKSFISLFLPVAVGVLGLVIRSSHPTLGHTLLVAAGVWMVVGVVLRHRAPRHSAFDYASVHEMTPEASVRQTASMRITDSTGQSLSNVFLALNDEEAKELIGALEKLQKAEKGWHEHVSDASYQIEVTVYREDDE